MANLIPIIIRLKGRGGDGPDLGLASYDPDCETKEAAVRRFNAAFARGEQASPRPEAIDGKASARRAP